MTDTHHADQDDPATPETADGPTTPEPPRPPAPPGPQPGSGSDGRGPGRVGRRRVVIGALVATAVVGGFAVVAANDANDTSTDTVEAGGPGDATVAVAHVTGGGEVRPPLGFVARIVDPGGATVAERPWSDVEQPPPDADALAVTDPDLADDVWAARGLLMGVPAGELTLEATITTDGRTETCSQPFTAAAGDQLVLRVQLGATVPDRTSDGQEVTDCATVEPVAEWAEPTTAGGEPYVGLTLPEAEALAADEGHEIRIVGEDGVGLARTDDLRPDRVDLMLFDGEVVSAALGADQPGAVADAG